MIATTRILRMALAAAGLGIQLSHPANASPANLSDFWRSAAAFDAATDLEDAERRVVKFALAVSGDYAGPFDQTWTQAGQAALEAYAKREFMSGIEKTHVAALVLTLLAEIDTRGWQMRYLPEFDISLALPEKILHISEEEDGGQRWWSEDGSITLLVHDFEPDMAVAWHSAARGANADAEVLRIKDSEDVLESRGVLSDGRIFRTASIRRGDQWPTIYAAGDKKAVRELDFMAATLSGGEIPNWDVPLGGQLETMILETLASFRDPGLLEESLPPEPVRVEPPQASPHASLASGTAFYVARNVLLTASHVVSGCQRIGLADGTRLELLASDSELDVAALSADAPASAWLSLDRAHAGRLGQTLHAAGYPYYNIAGTSLHLTAGNVSSLADVNDDPRFFSFSAPVQPGNSGGPLIDAEGAVVGVVVSRLSERYIAEATGTLPQNINYGLSGSELTGFLRRSAIDPEPEGLAQFDMEKGVPDGFEAAIVPVLCD
jgi:serine protease Do